MWFDAQAALAKMAQAGLEQAARLPQALPHVAQAARVARFLSAESENASVRSASLHVFLPGSPGAVRAARLPTHPPTCTICGTADWHVGNTDRNGRFMHGTCRVTCALNAEVKAVHPKAVPVILTTLPELDTWLSAPFELAATLQWSLLDGALRLVAEPV